jgi:hypothetical protein
MAKKTGKPSMPATVTQAELRSVRLQLPLEEHRKLRRLAADHDTNMALLARKIVQEYLARHRPKEID